jgi:hypothetical protein
MSTPCPFCGDERTPNTELVLHDHEGDLVSAVCQCCGAEDPSTRTRGTALVMWDNRTPPGQNAEFHALFNRVNPR